MESVELDPPKENEDPSTGLDPKAELLNNIKDPQHHYENVKMKYFASLGMSKPPSQPTVKRDRATTAPATLPARRSSAPAAPSVQEEGIPIPNNNPYRHHRGSSDEDIFQMDDSPSSSTIPSDTEANIIKPRRGFIPPHEMVKQNIDFEVGTARSLAIYETRKRNMLDIS